MVDRVKPEGFEYFHLRTRSWDGAQGQFWNSDFSVFQYHSSGSGWRSPEGLQIVRYRRDKLISTLRKGFNVNGIVVLAAQVIVLRARNTSSPSNLAAAFDKAATQTGAREVALAPANGAEVARIVLDIDPSREPERARRAWESHLARANWMTEHGYRHLLRGGAPH